MESLLVTVAQGLANSTQTDPFKRSEDNALKISGCDCFQHDRIISIPYRNPQQVSLVNSL